MSLQTVIETCWDSKHQPHQVMRKANGIHWAAQDGDWRASLGYIQIDPNSGEAIYSLAGSVQAFEVNSRGYRMLPGITTVLGAMPDTLFKSQRLSLNGGELIAFASPGLLAGAARGGVSQNDLLQMLRELQEEPVGSIADYIARQLPLNQERALPLLDRSLLLLRRKF
jgi:serine phosphatase RsbU (regulator of sigma subunit)